MNKDSKLFIVKNIENIAASSEEERLEFEPIEGLQGWYLQTYTAEEAGLDWVVLSCEANADVNPLHSGGDVNWLGWVADGPIEMILGGADEVQTSSRIVQPGDYLTFAPDTFHGWVPGSNPARLVFVKLKG
ncbi:MAG: hypothetical protein PQJ61_02895 [Spirochaetales bacterium]|uniref:Cupin domain-containing protein n=1 Tax=Candidatus Thalassospirochaeta sargassi TaxID=3119039 RepID=A0AAJ1MMR5_9SPIO|nr:hypothetical protein [Spirochaetales bacterium]